MGMRRSRSSAGDPFSGPGGFVSGGRRETTTANADASKVTTSGGRNGGRKVSTARAEASKVTTTATGGRKWNCSTMTTTNEAGVAGLAGLPCGDR